MVNPGENCTDIVNNANPPVTMLQLYQLNPGIMCSSNSSSDSQRLVGQQVSEDLHKQVQSQQFASSTNFYV